MNLLKPKEDHVIPWLKTSEWLPVCLRTVSEIPTGTHRGPRPLHSLSSPSCQSHCASSLFLECSPPGGFHAPSPSLCWCLHIPFTLWDPLTVSASAPWPTSPALASSRALTAPEVNIHLLAVSATMMSASQKQRPCLVPTLPASWSKAWQTTTCHHLSAWLVPMIQESSVSHTCVHQTPL